MRHVGGHKEKCDNKSNQTCYQLSRLKFMIFFGKFHKITARQIRKTIWMSAAKTGSYTRGNKLIKSTMISVTCTDGILTTNYILNKYV